MASLLRRWKPFFPAFGAIDACIEAAAPEGYSRDMYRQVRGNIVEMLCDAAGDGRAEELCRLLDVAMAEALEMLRVVPVTPAMLTTTDVAKAVGGLLGHECGRVRGLARVVLSGWRASIEATLDTLLQISRHEHEVAAAAGAPAPVTGCARSGGTAPKMTLVRAVEANLQADLRHGVPLPEEDASWRSHGCPWRRSRQEHGDDRRCKAQTLSQKRTEDAMVEHGPRKKLPPAMKRSTDETS